MPTAIKLSPSSRGTNPETVLDTGLNSLANGSGATSGAVNNSTELDHFVDIEVVLASLTPTVQDVQLYLVNQIDGTNYEDVPPLAGYVGSVYPTTSTGAKRLVLRGVPIPPRDFKVHLINRTGVSLGASGNTVKLYFWRLQLV